MKFLYIIFTPLFVLLFFRCSDQKEEKIFITFEFDNSSQKKELIKRVKELHFNDLEEIENSSELEWSITIENEFSKEVIRLLFRKDSSYVVAQLIDLDYIETDMPQLFETGIIDRSMDYSTGQIGLFDPIYTDEIFEAIEQMKIKDNDLWLRYFTLPNYIEDGRSALVLYSTVDQLDFSPYISKVVLTKEDRDEVGSDTEYLLVTMENEGGQLLHQVTSSSEKYFLALVSNGNLISYLMVNAPITMGTVEMYGDGILKSMLNALLLKDLPGATIKQMDLINIKTKL